MSTRLDNYLTINLYAPSRSKAQEMIKSGIVLVNNKVILKNNYQIQENDNIKILENEVTKYVSRGGLKLQKALSYFNISLKDKVVCDIGASTGGFTDCSLKHGASYVYSIDVGTNQLDESLKDNDSVCSIENLNFKDFSLSMIDKKIDYYVCDVSFISINKIITHLNEIEQNFNLICLFKPQFEVGKNKLNKQGVVSNQKDVLTSVINFDLFLKSCNLKLINFTFSPLLGHKEGNVEFLAYISSDGNYANIDYKSIVNNAFKELKVR